MAREGDEPPVYWLVWDVLLWMAYGECPPAMSIPTTRPSPGHSADVVAALRARAAGNPRLWRPVAEATFAPAWRYRATARRWLGKLGVSASELLLIAEKELAERIEAEAHNKNIIDRCRAELARLNHAVASGSIEAFGRPTDEPMRNSSRPLEPISPLLVDEVRQINIHGHLLPTGNFGWLERKPPFYCDVRLRVTDVKRKLPATKVNLIAATIAEEKKLEVWLLKRMLAARDAPPGKEAVKRDARQAGFRTGRGFVRAWEAALKAADAPRWAAPGRKSKR